MSEKIIYLGNFGEKLENNSGEYIKEAEMFSTGVHRGVEYTEEDLNVLVDNFKAEEDIPVQLDHSDSAKDTVGYIREAYSKDGKLMGKLEILDEAIQERIDKKLMKKLSVSFYLKHSEEGFKPHKIREVSLVAFPQVKGSRLFSENGYVSDYEETQKGGNEEMGNENTQVQYSEDQVKQLIENYGEVSKQLQALQGINEQFAEAQVTNKVEKFQADNLVVPAQADSLKQLMKSFSKEQADLFDEFMKNSNKVDLSEAGQVDHSEHEDDKEDKRTKEQKEFDAFYEEHEKAFGTSL